MAQELETIGILPFRIAVREMHSDIAQAASSQNRVSDGVAQDVGVGMSVEAEVGRNLNASQDQLSSANNAMAVPPKSSANLCHFLTPSGGFAAGKTPVVLIKKQPRQFHVTGAGNLDIPLAP